MRLHVRHQTAYHYDRPINYAIQTLRLSPQPYDGIQIFRWRVTGETRRPLPSFTDGFGNVVHCHTVNHVHTRAAVFVDGEVETRDTGGVVAGAAEPLPPVFFLRRTKLTSPAPEIAALANETARGNTPMERMMSLMMAVREKVAYRSGITTSHTTAAESLGLGVGVCQDHAHIMIAAARALGIPARYAGGYVWPGEGGGEGGEDQASHAWAEIFLPDMGWVGFDASNGVHVTEAHIRTAVGLDYWEAAPVRGLRRGDAEEHLSVKVNVRRAQAQQ